LFIEGPAESPTWKQIIDGKEVCVGKYNGTIASGETLVVHSKPGENGIYILNDGSYTDVYQNSDFTTERFMLIRYGENKFTVVDSNDDPVTCRMEGELYYESV
jgi:hypothetical protein